MTWFWVAYISLGLWILMPGIVLAWDTVDEDKTIKVVGTIVAVLLWPLAFVKWGK